MTTINANMNSSVDWVPVADPVNFAPGLYTLDSENIEVGGLHLINPEKTWSAPNGRWIARGIGGSTAASHSSGATLTRYYPDAPGGGSTPTLAEVLAAGNDANSVLQSVTAGDVPLTVQGIAGQGDADYADLLRVTNADTTRVFVVDSSGDVNIRVLAGASFVVTNGVQQIYFDGDTGLVKLLNLPTSDPAVAGALWSDSLVVKVSAG